MQQEGSGLLLLASLCTLLCWRIPKYKANWVFSGFLSYRAHIETAETVTAVGIHHTSTKYLRNVTVGETFHYKGDM